MFCGTVIIRIRNLLGQVFQSFLYLLDSCHNRHPVNRCDRCSLCHHLTIGNEKLSELYLRRNRNCYRIIFRQGTAADQFGVDAAGADCAGENTGLRSICFRVLFGYQWHRRQKNHDCHDANQGDDPLYILFSCFIHALTSIVQGINGFHFGCLVGRVQAKDYTDDKAEYNCNQNHTAI